MSLLIFQYKTGAGTIPTIWITSLQQANVESGWDIVVDSLNNTYVSGETYSGTKDAFLAKLDEHGALTWQRRLGGTGTEEGYSVSLDSTETPYIIVQSNSVGSGNYDAVTAKYDSNGIIQWQQVLGDFTYNFATGITHDSSNNVIICGSQNSNATILVAKYNSSGTLQWQKVINGSGNEYGHKIDTDSNDNIYCWGQTTSGGAGSWDMYLCKMDSAGNNIWQRALGGTALDTSSAGYPDIHIDKTTNDCYVLGSTADDGITPAGFYRMVFAKYDENGNLQWQKTWGHDGTLNTGSVNPGGITTDSSGNVYVTTTGTGSYTLGDITSTNILIAKFNSSGTVLWQRIFGGDGLTNFSSRGIAHHNNSIYITGTTGESTTSNDVLIMKLPDDGSGTGILEGTKTFYYQDISSESELVINTSLLTNTPLSLSISNSSYTDQISTLTDQAGTLTENNYLTIV